MITPSKTISFKESMMFKMTYILDVEFEEISLAELYQNTKVKFLGLDEFLYALDTLYVLGKVDVNLNLGRIRRC